PPTLTLFDFTRPTEELKALWGAVDDVVMGGVSESNLQLTDNAALFSGIVSTANSGGFASVRHRNFDPPLDLSEYDGIQLRVKGDGLRYKFILRCEGKWDGVSYCYSFDTAANAWLDVFVPFADLIPTFRAKTVGDAGKFDASRTYAMQLMLSKFEYDGALNPQFSPGSFSLFVESIKAYGGNPKPQFLFVSSAGVARLGSGSEVIEEICLKAVQGNT
ncbi:CIA30 family protein, partial [Lusitaniella coriacea LEGE 07157]